MFEIAALAVALTATAPEPEPVVKFPAPTDRVHFGEAVARALDRNPTAAIAAAELRRAADLVEQARASSLPNLQAYAEYVRIGPASLAGSSVQAGSAGAPTSAASPQVYVSALDNYLAGGQVNVPLFAPPAWVQWAHARNDRAAAVWTEKEARRELAIGAAHAYLNVITQRRIVELNQRASENDRTHYTYVQQRQRGGLGRPLDEMRARQQYESDRSQLQSAVLALERAQEALGVLLGEEHAIDAAEVPELAAPPAPGDNGEEHRLLELRPNLQALLAQRGAAQQVVDDAWADFAPTLAFSFQPLYENPPIAQSTFWSWELFFTANWTLYDGGLRYGQHKERREKLTEANEQLRAQLLQASADVRVGYKAVQRTEAALQAAKDAAAAAHQAFDVASLQYNAGATTNIDVVDAERRAHDADTAAAIAEDGVRQARLDLLAALGRFPDAPLQR